MTKVPTQQVVLAAVWALAAIQVAGGAEARRVRLDSLDEIIEIRAAVRHTTVIALPADELIADFVAGDTEFWQLQGEANIAYLKPQAKGEKTNVALVTRSGNIYSFLCREGGGEPDLVVHVEVGEPGEPGGGKIGSPVHQPAFVAASEVSGYEAAARDAIEDASRARAAAERTIEEQVEAARPPTRPASLASSCSASTTANRCRLPWQLRLSSTASNCARSERSSAAG